MKWSTITVRLYIFRCTEAFDFIQVWNNCNRDRESLHAFPDFHLTVYQRISSISLNGSIPSHLSWSTCFNLGCRPILFQHLWIITENDRFERAAPIRLPLWHLQDSMAPLMFSRFTDCRHGLTSVIWGSGNEENWKCFEIIPFSFSCLKVRHHQTCSCCKVAEVTRH